MEISAKNSISTNIESRINSHLRFKLGNSSHQFSTFSKSEKFRTLKLLVKVILERDLDTSLIHSDFIPIVLQLRLFLGEAYVFSPDKPMAYTIKTRPDLFLSLMGFLSMEAQKASEEFIDLIVESEARFDDTKSRTNFMESQIRTRGSIERSKAFSLLPIWKMSPAFPYYSDSVIKAVFNDKYSSVTELIGKNFDLSRVKRKGYKPSGFRSDGYQVQVSFMASKSRKPLPIGTDKLCKAGYQIPKRTVDLVLDKRGLFVVGQERMDPKKIKLNQIPTFRLTVVDPGCSSVVSVRECDLENCTDSKAIVKDSSTWELKGSSYSEQSGRNMLQKRENKRRSNQVYKSAIDSYSSVRKKTALIQTFLEYGRVAAMTFNTMYIEKNRRSRKRSRLQSSRLVQSVVDKLANIIAFSESDKKHIVLFGNGSFSAKKGHASCPRKSLVRSLASRVLVGILDEFRTSKNCSGGCGSEMVGVTKVKRVRQCSTVINAGVNPCPLSGLNGSSFRCDRDESSTINFDLIGYQSLIYKRWPEHLKRS